MCALGCALVLVTAAAAAQDKGGTERTSAEWLALIQADRKALVAKAMELSIAAGHTLTDANAKRIVEQTLAAEKEIARLKDKHFRKLLKALPAHRAARYVQVENKIQAVVAYEGAKAVPLAR